MNYFTSKQAADRWGITPNRVTILCNNGKIHGAVQIGGQWMIPNGTEKPKDGRTKAAKAEATEEIFRFPLYVNSDEDEFSPRLTDEESRLRKAELDYYACRFDEAKEVFDNMAKTAKSTYIRIMSLFYLSSLSVEAYDGDGFLRYTGRLELEFFEEFPHKKDMEIVIPWLYTISVQIQTVSSSLNFNTFYEYSPTVLPMIEYLSFFHLSNIDSDKTADIHLDVYEILCRDFMKTGHYYEACELYFLLFLANYVSLREDVMLYYLKKGLTIAKEHKFYLIAASYEFYYQNAFDIVLKEFPEDFAKIIKHNSKIISNSLGKFSKEYNNNKVYNTLSPNDYRYLLFAVYGKTNREVANIMNVSERTVANRYNEIYNKIGVNSKQELVDEMNATLGNKQ